MSFSMMMMMMSYIKAEKDLVKKNSFLAQRDIVKEWLSSFTHLNEQIIDTFIENEADTELIDKENEEEVLFNLRMLNDLSVCEEKIC